MQYIVSFPPCTKDAKGVVNGHTVIVVCPHCGKNHYHPRVDVFKFFVEAHCKQGYYVIREENGHGRNT